MSPVVQNASRGPVEIGLSVDGNAPLRFRPRDTVAGVATINCVNPVEPEYAELMLFWRTEGRGDEDHEVVAIERLVPTGARLGAGREERRFSFQLPDMPWTHHGRLLKLNWTVGLYVKSPGLDELFVEVPFVLHARPEVFAAAADAPRAS